MQNSGVWALIEDRARQTPESLFLLDDRDEKMTFAAFRDQAKNLSVSLAEKGIKQGDVVSWILPTWMETLVLCGALSRIGAIQNPIIPILREREVTFITSQTRADFIVTPGVWGNFDYSQLVRSVRRSRPELQEIVFTRSTVPNTDVIAAAPLKENEPSWYFYSSGTTSDPKGAIHTDKTLIAAARSVIEGLELTDGDRVPVAFPVTHIAGPIYMLFSMLSGCSLCLAEKFDPIQTLKQFASQQITLAGPGTPFVSAFITRQNEAGTEALFPSVRAFLSGGAPKPSTLSADVEQKFGVPLISSYGLTESPMVTYSKIGDDKAALASSEGRALSTVELAVFDSDNRRVGPNEEGEVRIKAPQVMLGYLDASLNESAFDPDGFFRTGDLGRLDLERNLTITGRIKEIIIRNMENISATEVESMLFKHDDVADIAIIGLPDARTGERVCAVVVPKDNSRPPTLELLCEFLVGAGLSKRKVPEQLEITDILPRNPMGKVLKNDLKARYSPKMQAVAQSNG